MRPRQLLATLALAASLAAAPRLSSPAVAAPPAGTLCGFNVAWIAGKWGTGLTTKFDAADWQRVFARAASAHAKVVRVWILHGIPSAGVIWDKSDPHVPLGVDAALLQNLPQVAAIARAQGVRVYWTLMDGAVPLHGLVMSDLDRERFWNVYNGDFGIGDLWRTNVLGPVLDAIGKTPDAIYAIDILNEIEGPLASDLFRGKWLGARRFMADTARFVHGRLPGVRVTSSAGWGDAPWDILLGSFDGVGLDFLDIHAYADRGAIPFGDLLAWHARSKGMPIVLGEFGQSSKAKDPALQAKVVAGFLGDAKRLGFEAALAWRLEDEDPRFSFFDGSAPRPALATFDWLATH